MAGSGNDLQGQVIDALRSLADAVGRGLRVTWVFLRRTVFTDANLAWTRELLWDGLRSVAGVVRVAPSLGGAIALFGDEIVGTTVGWTAGLLGASLVGQFFEARGVQNLWGLFGRKDKMLVSRETYELLSGLTSFLVGLVVLIVVRHFVRSWVTEFRRVREARRVAEAEARAEAVRRDVERSAEE